MNRVIKQGDVFEFDYPFHGYKALAVDGTSLHLTPGCHKDEEWDDVFSNISYTANFIGKVVFEVLSIAQMPGKYVDRVIVKKYYLLPGGEKFSRGNVECMTCLKLIRYIEGHKNTFPWEYEVDKDYESVVKHGDVFI